MQTLRKNDDIGTGIVGLTITSNNYERMITMKYLFKDQIPEVEFVNSSKAIYLEKRITNKIYFHDVNNRSITKGKGISEVLDYLDKIDHDDGYLNNMDFTLNKKIVNILERYGLIKRHMGKKSKCETCPYHEELKKEQVGVVKKLARIFGGQK